MNDDLAIRLQAYLDGELPSGERAEFEVQLARDPELQALRAELSMVGRALKEADPVVTVPETREFYWSQLQRRIESAERLAPSQPSRPALTEWLRRLLLPLSGVALASLVLTTSLRQTSLPLGIGLHEETESPLSETGALTFRSEAEKVTVVWLYDRDQPLTEDGLENVN